MEIKLDNKNYLKSDSNSFSRCIDMKKILFILIICLSFIGYSKTMLHITSVGDMCGVTYYLGIKNNVPVFRGGCVLRGQFFDNLVIIPDYEYINEDYIDLKNNILANNNIIAFRENGNILIDDNGAVYFHREAVLGYISANKLKGILSKNKIIY